MRGLVISGGGSKGAFAGGVAQYLIEELKYDYGLFVGTSTGSLLLTHLALDKVKKIKKVFTSVNQNSIFSNCPFVIKKERFGSRQIGVNHFNVFKNLFCRISKSLLKAPLINGIWSLRALKRTGARRASPVKLPLPAHAPHLLPCRRWP